MEDKKIKGLSAKEVAKQIELGNINRFDSDNSNEYSEIIKRNIFTLFNFLNLVIAIALASVQAWSNMLFFMVIVLNSASGIAIEVRAKRMIDKLNLMSREKVRVLRAGRWQKIDPEEIVLGDVVEISAGDQIPSDGEVLQGLAEANEAMLTGESDLVLKETGAEVLSGSFLTSGKIIVKINQVGEHNYAAKLMTEAKVHKPINSKILFSLDRIANFTGKIIIPFGIILFLEAFLLKNLSAKYAVIYTAAPLLGMLPKGVALLTITSLLTAVIKLGMRKVLVQEMYSVETLARVDTLCLDKTGTITEGKMEVEEIHFLSKNFSNEEIEKMLAAYMQISEDSNQTAIAIRKYTSKIKHNFEASNIIPFSSDRKWGSMELEGVGTVLLGAPEILFSQTPKQVKEAQSRGSRVLALAFSDSKIDKNQIALPSKLQKLAVLEITDPIREGAKETLEYLRTQSVDLKIISGDNPVTVSNIAEKAGFKDFESYVDCSQISDQKLRAIAEKTAIFGRVSPHQKKLLVRTLKKKGRTVAMTGDGVNDILALREADCSIAMAEGDPATRQVANLVLLNSDFNDVPEILFEGRRVVNNIAKIAPIFFIKTIYSFLLAVVCIGSVALGADAVMIFPFIPLQVTMVDQIMEGFPPFVLTFERSDAPIEKDFLKKSMFMALPSALMIVISIIFVTVFGQNNGWIPREISTTLYYLLGSISFFAVVRACIPFNKLRIALLVETVAMFFATAILFRSILEIGTLTDKTLPIYLAITAISAIIFVAIEVLQKINFRDKIKA
ncbi:MAG: HAD-IC family P-type ATPase [bacterium]|nr:HAD-IC family P-type ATPase [bacterium]